MKDIDYVVCEICKMQYKVLGPHIKHKHHIPINEYKLKYPNSPIFSKDVINRISKNVSGENNAHWKGGILEKRKLKREQEIKDGNEGKEYVTCLECGKKLIQITTLHLRKGCSDKCKTTKEYLNIHPNAKVVCKKRLSNSRNLTKEQIRERSAIGSVVGHTKDIYTIYKEYGYDGTTSPVCSCGCGKYVKRSELYPYNWNKFIHRHNVTEPLKEWKRTHPEELKRNKEKAIQGMKNYVKFMKENCPEEYSRLQSENAIKFHKKNPNFAHENTKKLHKKYPDLGLRAYEGRIKNSPWYFMGVPFGSHQESDIAKLRFELLGIVPIPLVNCHVRIKNKEFDFEQFGFVHEHHPEQQYRGEGKGHTEIDSEREYYDKRRKILDNNGHKNSELIVTTKVREVVNMYRWLRKHLSMEEPYNKEVVVWM